MNNFKAFLLLATLLCYISCNDGLDLVGPNNAPPTMRPTNLVFPTPGEVQSIFLIGNVLNVDGEPVPGAAVTCLSCVDNITVMTGDSGDFTFESVENEGDQAYLSITNSGNFDSYKRVALVEDKINFTSIRLRSRSIIDRISTTEGGLIELDNGASLKLSEGGIVNSEGNTYSGEYNVYFDWIDPTDPNLNETMMGDLSAIDTEGNLVGLSTFGMLQVELRTDDNEHLNLAGNTIAELQFPVPEELLDIAPDIIPLWSYDEDYGYWVEEGEAILFNGKYTGRVAHFSTWNVDAKTDPVSICGKIEIITRGTPIGLSFYDVRLCGDSFNSVGGWLCHDGSYTFNNVPSSENIQLKIYDFCGTLLHVENLGAFSEDTKIDPIVVPDTEGFELVNISGNALNCDSTNIENGQIFVDFDTRRYLFPIEESGNFDFGVPICGNETGSMEILNGDNLKSSAPIQISRINKSFVFDDILICEESEEYFYLDIINSNNAEDSIFSYLISHPIDLWYRVEDDIFFFEGKLTQVNDEFSNNKFTFRFSQNLILDQDINGAHMDGLIITDDAGNPVELSGDGHGTFLFTEIGPLNANGLPSIITGSYETSFIPFYPGLSTKSSFRLKPR